MVRVDLGPSTNWMPSPQLDFPDPLGPVMAEKPRSRGIITSPRNDLKFSISSAFRNIPIPLPDISLTLTRTPFVEGI